MIGAIPRLSLGIATVVGGFALTIFFGLRGVCTTPSGYCIDFPGLEWVFNYLGIAVTPFGWVLIFTGVRQLSKI